MTPKRLTIVATVLAVLAAAARPAAAHFAERTDSLYGFVSRSELIAIGTIVRSQRFEERRHTTLPGAVRLKVEEVLRGAAPGPEVGVRIEGMHQPRYSEGERTLVFASRREGVLRSLQSRTEKVPVAADREDPVVDTVRRYVAIARQPDTDERLHALKEITLELLRSPVPRLHEDAVFDLSRPGLLDSHIADEELAALGALALAAKTPLVVREGVTHKLAALLAAGREAALAPLGRLARDAGNPVVRVAALNGLRAAPRAGAARFVIGSLEAENAHVRRAAVEALEALERPGDVKHLAARAGDADRRVRFAALLALARAGQSEAAVTLDRLRKEGDEDLRRAIDLAVAQSSPRSANP